MGKKKCEEQGTRTLEGFEYVYTTIKRDNYLNLVFKSVGETRATIAPTPGISRSTLKLGGSREIRTPFFIVLDAESEFEFLLIFYIIPCSGDQFFACLSILDQNPNLHDFHSYCIFMYFT